MSLILKEMASEHVLCEANKEQCQLDVSDKRKSTEGRGSVCANVLRQGCACHHHQ